MSAKSLFFAVASTAAVVSAQGTCGQDLLVDDFSAIRRMSYSLQCYDVGNHVCEIMHI